MSILSRDLAPVAFVYVLFLVMLFVFGRKAAPIQRRVGSERPPSASWRNLPRHLLVTAVPGYVLFLVIVAVFHVVLGGGSWNVIADAARGGAYLAFLVATPLFFVASLLGR